MSNYMDILEWIFVLGLFLEFNVIKVVKKEENIFVVVGFGVGKIELFV